MQNIFVRQSLIISQNYDLPVDNKPVITTIYLLVVIAHGAVSPEFGPDGSRAGSIPENF